MTRTCFRCGDELDEPVEQNAAYVVGEDTTCTETMEVTEAVVHTQATKDALDKLQANHYPETAVDELERAVVSSTDLVSYLGTPPQDSGNDAATREENAKNVAPALSDFDHTEITDVANAPEGTVKVESVLKERTVEKTGLVHTGCTEDTDDVIWTADS